MSNLNSVKTFKPYAKLGKSNSVVQNRICDLLFNLVNTESVEKVKELCDKEIRWMEDTYENPNTRTSYVTAHRKAIRAYFDSNPPVENLLREYKNKKQHVSLCHLFANEKDYLQKSKGTKVKTAIQRDNLTAFNPELALEVTTKLLRSNNWRELAVGLIMASQSRPSDLLKAGDFKAATKYKLSFTSRAKKRGKAVTGEIYCLVDSLTFIDAFNRFKRMPEIREVQDWQLKDIDSAKNKTLNRAVKKLFGDDRDGGAVIPTPYGEKELSCKNLRAAGVNVAFWLHGRDNQAIGRFAELQLLHDNPGTAANYEDFYCIDETGKRRTEVGILKDDELKGKPMNQKRSSVTVNRQQLEIISDENLWGPGTNAERLERIISSAERTVKAESLYDRESQRRYVAEQRLAKGSSGEVTNSTVDISPVVKNYEDITLISNTDLLRSKTHNASDEKMRRSFEAVKEYNSGKHDSDRYAVNTSLLRQLTKSRASTVKAWMTAHADELTEYENEWEPTYRQNVGKPDPRTVMKWSEVIYGEYEW